MHARWRNIASRTFADWWEDKAPRLGAALAYYSVLALAPLVILVTPVAELLVGRDDAQTEVVGQFAELVGPQGEKAVRSVLADVTQQAHRDMGLARALGLAVLLFGASGVFVELQDALNTIWEVTPRPGASAIWGFIRQRFLSFAMVLGTGFLLIVSLLFSAALGMLRQRADEQIQSLAWLWTILSGVLSFAVVTLLFAMIFKVLPDVIVPWRGVWLGAVLTTLLFSAGRFAIGTYLGKAGIGTGYGAAGSIVVVLVWVYYSSQILYLGAEFTKAYTQTVGERAEPMEHAVPITEEARAQQGITHQEVVEAVTEVVEKKEAERASDETVDASELHDPPRL